MSEILLLASFFFILFRLSFFFFWILDGDWASISWPFISWFRDANSSCVPKIISGMCMVSSIVLGRRSPPPPGGAGGYLITLLLCAQKKVGWTSGTCLSWFRKNLVLVGYGYDLLRFCQCVFVFYSSVLHVTVSHCNLKIFLLFCWSLYFLL